MAAPSFAADLDQFAGIHIATVAADGHQTGGSRGLSDVGVRGGCGFSCVGCSDAVRRVVCLKLSKSTGCSRAHWRLEVAHWISCG
jgi:hypothetical protein